MHKLSTKIEHVLSNPKMIAVYSIPFVLYHIVNTDNSCILFRVLFSPLIAMAAYALHRAQP